MNQPDLPRIRVLVVDDDVDWREALATLLQVEGFEARSSSGGRATASALEDSAADVVIVDISAATLDGDALARALVRGRDHEERPALVVHSHGAPPGTAATAFQDMFDLWCVEPIDLGSMPQTLRDLLERLPRRRLRNAPGLRQVVPAVEVVRAPEGIAEASGSLFDGLLALDIERSFEAAAARCGYSLDAFLALIRDAEITYGRPVVREVPAFGGFTSIGDAVLACARTLGSPDATPSIARPKPGATATLLSRRSVSPKRLGGAGPTHAEMDLIVRCALSAPDHGALRPWRVIEFKQDARTALATLFEQEKLRRDPLASREDLELAREHATRAPALVGFIVSPRAKANVPVQEQWLAAGAALGNFLNAAHSLGYGAIVLSGERCHDPILKNELGIHSTEFLAGFISLGRIIQVPPSRKLPSTDRVRSEWTPGLPAQRPAGTASMPLSPPVSPPDA